MAFSSLENLYRQIIMDHYKKPRNKGLQQGGGYRHVHLKNPTCGDDVTVGVKLVDGVLEDIRHEGVGCSICCSSASVMSDILKDKHIDDAERIILNFYEIVKGAAFDKTLPMGDAVAYAGVANFPARIKCATIPWKALETAIHSSEDTSAEVHE